MSSNDRGDKRVVRGEATEEGGCSTMAESAIRIEGIDETTRRHVRIHLRVLTSEESVPAVAKFAAPRGFLPGASGQEVVGRRAAYVSNSQVQVFGSVRSAESPGVPRVFAVPRGFIPEP